MKYLFTLTLLFAFTQTVLSQSACDCRSSCWNRKGLACTYTVDSKSHIYLWYFKL